MSIFPISSWHELVLYWRCDLQRYGMGQSAKAWLRAWYITGFRYCFFMRACRYFSTKRLYMPLYAVARIALRHYSIKYGYQIPWQADVGPGLYVGHYGPIIVNPNSVIGANCNITVGVVLGLARFPSDKVGYPRVGHRVWMGNSSKILGGIWVADGAFTAPWAVVTRDVAPNAIVGGVPAKTLSFKGSWPYMGNFLSLSLPYMQRPVITNQGQMLSAFRRGRQ